MFTLKSLSKKGVPAALEKAEKYRPLNEPKEAESICLDVLEIDPKNHKALVMLLLSITDQFGESISAEAERARELLPRLRDKYKRHYYEGIIFERQAKAVLRQGSPGAKSHAYEWLRDAMDQFEKAEALRPSGNDDAILRWNTCARMIMENNLTPREEEYLQPLLE